MAITVSKQFKHDFDLCMDYYEVTGEELEFEKKRVRENYAEAARFYADRAPVFKRLMRIAA